MSESYQIWKEGDYIVCKICEQKVTYISPSHIKKHDISLQEYKKLYGEIYSPNYKIKRSQVSKDVCLKRFSDPENVNKQRDVLSRNNKNVRDYPGWLKSNQDTMKRITTLDTRKKGGSVALKKLWEFNRDKALLIVDKALRAQHALPNQLELYFSWLCSKYDIPLRYVGDRKLYIGRKNPDFVNEDKKIVVEIWGNFWHDNDDPNIRINYFRSHGWKCLILKENEIYDKSSEVQLISKVQEVFV